MVEGHFLKTWPGSPTGVLMSCSPQNHHHTQAPPSTGRVLGAADGPLPGYCWGRNTIVIFCICYFLYPCDASLQRSYSVLLASLLKWLKERCHRARLYFRYINLYSVQWEAISSPVWLKKCVVCLFKRLSLPLGFTIVEPACPTLIHI